MTRTDLLNEIKKLNADIDKCISDLIVARGKRDMNGIASAHWRMESLMVATQQDLSVIYNFIKDRKYSNDRY